MIDTGAVANVLSSTVLNKMAAADRPVLRQAEKVLTGAGGRPLKVRGEVLLPLDLTDAQFLGVFRCCLD